MERIDDIVPEKINVGVSILADVLTPGAKVNDGRRWNRNFRGQRRCRTKKFEVIHVDRSMPAPPRQGARNQQRKLTALAIDEINFVDRRRVVGDRAAAKA